MKPEKLIQSVPNFSEGRNLQAVEEIVDSFRARPGVKLLDYSTDPDMNRCVVTVAGEEEALRTAMSEAIGTAVRVIDMTKQEGAHPRIGAADVIPFIPLRDSTMEDADRLARAVAADAAERYGLPVYLYAASAAAPYRADLADIRAGQFEGLAEKMQNPLWKPDLGPDSPHPTAGAVAIGARTPIVFYNVNLDTRNVETARQIARRLRGRGGGLKCVKALGILSEERQLAQVTMEMTDYSQSALYTAFELVKIEARRYGVGVVSSEITGFVPLQAIADSAAYYLQLEDFSVDQILECQL